MCNIMVLIRRPCACASVFEKKKMKSGQACCCGANVGEEYTQKNVFQFALGVCDQLLKQHGRILHSVLRGP